MNRRTCKEVEVSVEEVHVRDKHGVTHIVESGPPPVFYAWPDGHVSMPFIAVMTCGARAKVNESSRSRYTNEPATCIVCIGGGYE